MAGGISLVAEHDLPKVETRVRFPYPAPKICRCSSLRRPAERDFGGQAVGRIKNKPT